MPDHLGQRVRPPDCLVPGCHRPSTVYIAHVGYCVDHGILKVAGWRCQAVIPDPRPWKTGEIRCPTVGSEIAAVHGEARCPRHRDA